MVLQNKNNGINTWQKYTTKNKVPLNFTKVENDSEAMEIGVS